jgi:TetR/AcrR family transcriptional regulator, transcriptional repressor for nem operon
MSTDTRTQLVADATRLVRRRGYAGFSYADLAETVGIRKPSIHHYFPFKEDLGVEIVDVYTERFKVSLADIWAEFDTASGRLSAYAELYREGLAVGEGCLCGVLASELSGLPPALKSGVERFFALNIEWLERVLLDGAKAPGKRRLAAARQRAQIILSAFQGAVFVALATNATETFDSAVSGLLSILQSETGHPQ